MSNDALEGLRTALAAEGDAVARLIALCANPRSTRDDRHKALDAYERLAPFTDLMLAEAIARPAPGLLDALQAACDAAFWRLGEAGTIADEAAYERAYAVGAHASDAMEARRLRVLREVVDPWAQAQAERRRRRDAAA